MAAVATQQTTSGDEPNASMMDEASGEATPLSRLSMTRKALVVGINNYSRSPLKSCINDAQAINEALIRMGFESQLATDCGAAELRRVTREFCDSLDPGDIAYFHFAGHGVEASVLQGDKYRTSNWLMSCEVPSCNAELPYHAIDAQSLLKMMEHRQTRFNALVLDCCRDDPLPAETRTVSGGLASILAPSGSMVAFSCAPRQRAAEFKGKIHSVFVEHLLKHIEEPGLSLSNLFIRVSNEVQLATAHLPVPQVPYVSSALRVEDACLLPQLSSHKRQKVDAINVQIELLIYVAHPRGMQLDVMREAEAVSGMVHGKATIMNGGHAEELKHALNVKSPQYLMYCGPGAVELAGPDSNLLEYTPGVNNIKANDDNFIFSTRDGHVENIPFQRIAELLTSSGGALEIVFLSGCSTERLGRALCGAGIPTVVCWTGLVLDEPSVIFSTAFFKAILEEGVDVVPAFEQAKLALTQTIAFSRQVSHGAELVHKWSFDSRASSYVGGAPLLLHNEDGY